MIRRKARGIARPAAQVNTPPAPIHTVNHFPPALIISLRSYDGSLAKPCVAVGNRVFKGECIATLPNGQHQHASTSGLISAIAMQPIELENKESLCITITPDGKDEWMSLPRLAHDPDELLDKSALCQHVARAGIIGHGGGGYPSAEKLAKTKRDAILIINGVECDPVINSDEALILEHTHAIVLGTLRLCQILQIKHAIIAIKNNKKHTDNLLVDTLKQIPGASSLIKLQRVANTYPIGAEKHLITALTGRVISDKQFAIDAGILSFNIATLLAIAQSLGTGKPLTQRVVTITGNAIKHPGNYRVLLGTPVRFLLEQAGVSENPAHVRLGGHFMGNDIKPNLTDVIGISARTQCVIATQQVSNAQHDAAHPCIRCDRCVSVCPSDLLPQQLHFAVLNDSTHLAKRYHITSCIECAACDFVCPSHIALASQFRAFKAKIKQNEEQQKASQAAKERYEAREARLATQARTQQEKLQALSEQAQSPLSPEALIQAAIARHKAKKTKQEKSS